MKKILLLEDEKTLAEFQGEKTTHFFYGSTPEVLEKLQQRVSLIWPDVHVVGAISPPYGLINEEEELKNIAIINKSRANFVWVGMGCPKQEKWMHIYRNQINANVILSVGAAFDFIAETVSQAPGFIQNAGLEWLYRLIMEPKRLWKRYLFRNPYFIGAFSVQYIQYILRKLVSTCSK
jgi:N-acetylglucosaminyldiphosphoundecaprenol N-acetyl-beta-D-mannosaminyltransferase